MKAVHWIIYFFLINIFIAILLYSWLVYKHIPPRFSNSISYDSKLEFIKKNNLVDGADTLIVGSSMALNNVNGITLETNSNRIHKVINTGSWGLEPLRILELLKSFNLHEIKYIIYSIQYTDFSQDWKKTIYHQSDVSNYLKNNFIFRPYAKRFTSMLSDFDEYNHLDETFHIPNRYKSLLFDRTGSVPLDINKNNIIKTRWEGINYLKDPVLKTSLRNLVKIVYLAQRFNIKIIIARPPIRPAVVKSIPHLKEKIDAFNTSLYDLAKRKKFIYINSAEKLHTTDKDYVDFEHLDTEGTILYTNAIIKYGEL